MLIEFIEAEHNVKGSRIDDKKSSNGCGAGGNKWLFPDVVGMENLTTGLHPEVVTAVRESGDRQIRLWSFEVKLRINRSNARETYFQAVSNSSWANFGYLVAANFEGAETLKELRILYARPFFRERVRLTAARHYRLAFPQQTPTSLTFARGS